jgi:hypothetical protein
MAAGQGFKTFTTGEVLTAGDVNGYLMQGVLVFASAAARNAAITSPQEGQFAFTKDTNGLWYYDGAAWVASGATGDIEGVTAGVGISGGGTSGTVTVTNSMATAIDAKGDLVAGTGADTFAKLTVGANDTVLTADSTAATGLKWATPAAGGGLTLISQYVAAADSAIDFTSISGSYKQLLLVWAGVKHSTTGSQFGLRLNADSGNNYQNQGMYAVNVGFGADSAVKSSIFVGGVDYFPFGAEANSSTLAEAPTGYIVIDNYSSTTKAKSYYGQWVHFHGSYTYNTPNFTGYYNSTSAITQVNIFRAAGSATLTNNADTTIRLYGIS